MLRILSSKIFREDLSSYGLSTISFSDFSDLDCVINFDNGTYKFLLPVSVGDFAEINVPACFSNNKDDLFMFYEQQKKIQHRSAFIISDFLVKDLEDILYSGIIHTASSNVNFDKETNIMITYKNPIITYGTEGISPRDLPYDVLVKYNRITDLEHSFPVKIEDNSNHSKKETNYILLQAFDAATKLHDISLSYDGNNYSNYTLFFVNKNGRINLYEVVGEESFIKRAKIPVDIIKEELDFVRKKGNSRILRK